MLAACLLALAPGAAPPAVPPPTGAVARFRAGPSLAAVAFSPDGKRLAALDAGRVHVWDNTTGKLLCQADVTGTGVAHLAFDGASLTWVAGRALWSWKDGERQPTRITTPRGTFAADHVQAVSPDGKVLARVTPADRRLRLAFLTEDRPERVLLNLASGYGHRLVYTDDARLVALSNAADRSVIIYEVATGTQVRRLMPGDAERSDPPLVRFAPDGRSLAKADREVRVLEATTGGQRLRLPRYGAVVAAAWSRDGRMLALGHADGRVVVADTFTGKEVFDRVVRQDGLTALAFSRDGRRLATGAVGGTIVVWPLPAAAREEVRLPRAMSWRDMAESDARGGFAAIRSLVAGADETVPWLAGRLTPTPVPDKKRIAQLVQDLDHDEFEMRERATEALIDIGLPAKEAIEAGLKGAQTREMRRRCETLLRKLTGFSVTPSELREARAVEVLEKIGSAQARAAMKKLLDAKPTPELGQALRGALRRLGEG